MAPMNTRRLFATTLGLGAVAHGLATLRAQKIRAGEDAVSYAQLREEPSAEERVVERPDGAEIYVRAEGSGPTVVLAHGYGVTLHAWNLVWTQLRQRGCRCVAFDLRGHGRSTIGSEGLGSAQIAGDYAAVFEALEIDEAVLVGHSIGGFMSLHAMLEHARVSEALRGFVGLATLAGEALRGSPQNRLQIPLIKLGVLQALVRSPTYGWMFGASMFGASPSPASIQLFNELFAAQDHRALLPVLDALRSESLYDRLHTLAVPSVIVCGERDQTTPRWHSEQLGVQIPVARNVWVPDKGHLLNWEAPEVVVAAVESLLG